MKIGGLLNWLRRHETRLVVGILGLGLVMRIIWLCLEPMERLRPHKSEMWRVAVGFAESGALQDAYAPGSGISSHVGPTGAILAGLIYRWFGVGSLASEWIMAVAAAAVATALFYMLFRLAAELAIPLVPRLAALCLVALVPLNFYFEVVDFRIRETALATLLATAGLVWLLRLDRQKVVTTKDLIGFAVLAGVTFLINPVLSLALYVGMGLVALRHLSPSRWPVGIVIAISAFAAVNGAWIVRNYQVYDRLMVSRGNFGLELAVANHPGATTPANAQSVFIARMKEIHPAFSSSALARLKTFPSDAAYFDMLGDEARTWIHQHPSEFAKASMRHLRELYFPPQWQWNLYNDGPKQGVALKQAFKAVITALAIIMLIVGLIERPRVWMFVGLSVVFPTILYMVLQPTLRYRYVFEGLFAFLALALIWRLFNLIGHFVLDRSRAGDQAPATLDRTA